MVQCHRGDDVTRGGLLGLWCVPGHQLYGKPPVCGMVGPVDPI